MRSDARRRLRKYEVDKLFFYDAKYRAFAILSARIPISSFGDVHQIEFIITKKCSMPPPHAAGGY